MNNLIKESLLVAERALAQLDCLSEDDKYEQFSDDDFDFAYEPMEGS